ncbi:MAG: 4-(cytidine 5'-diphospho)-2-C-methyl-D-erythritol kinase [Clostridia bacterium]|nr:4-(cytidine 5'-diphospho)-2-C-methyl-D-erythritol kinase [Clostridia bacterium]
MLVKCHAKINWSLDVLSRRPDGYHILDMIMQPLSLSDDLVISSLSSPGIDFSMEGGGGDIPVTDDNLVVRAARRLQEETGCGMGARMHLVKRIPSGAGLGGGSADAAGALAGLNVLWNLGLSKERLLSVSLSIGADVPFCLHGGLCRVGGIGEEIRPIAPAPIFPAVIIQNCAALSTGEIFRLYHCLEDPARPDTDHLEEIFLRNPALLPAHPGNVLEEVSIGKRPEILDARNYLLRSGATVAQMTGSGSAVFGIFADADSAEEAFRASPWKDGTFLCETSEQSIDIM